MGLQWKHALIIGASSGMGAALAKRLAAGGCQVALVARREVELSGVCEAINGGSGIPAFNRNAQDRQDGEGSPVPTGNPVHPVHPCLNIDSPERLLARSYPHDVRNVEEVPALFQQIAADMGGLDLVIYAAGVQPRIAPDEYSTEKDRLIVEVNVIGAMAWLNEAAKRFERAGGGTIVGIASIAGDRGRRGNPAYGASKAALEHFLEALRNRLWQRGVAVVTIKPGFVDTDLTRGLPKLFWLISADEAAEKILAAARRGPVTAYVPARWRLVGLIIRSIPSFLFRKLKI
jgi:NAD(P)-dependent dehydrogenase (short-subunit alcohol dehydrogenase family)